MKLKHLLKTLTLLALTLQLTDLHTHKIIPISEWKGQVLSRTGTYFLVISVKDADKKWQEISFPSTNYKIEMVNQAE